LKELINLNVGCGSDLRVGWVNLDKKVFDPRGVEFDLDAIPQNKLPFADGTVCRILMSHVIEHLNNPLPVLEELWRVAVNGCELVVRVPHGGNDEAWIDPTHTRPYFPRSFNYFGQPKYHKFDYGYEGDWRCEAVILVTPLLNSIQDVRKIQTLCDTNRNMVSEMVAVLTAIKPGRQRHPNLFNPPVVHYVTKIEGEFDEITEYIKKK